VVLSFNLASLPNKVFCNPSNQKDANNHLFFAICQGGIYASVGLLGKPLSGVLWYYIPAGVYSMVFSQTIYDIWQTAFVIHLLFQTKKRIAQHRKENDMEINNAIKIQITSQSSEVNQNIENMRKDVSLNTVQRNLTFKLIIASSMGFILLIIGAEMAILALDFDAVGNQTLFEAAAVR
jgi:hypothetical protein